MRQTLIWLRQKKLNYTKKYLTSKTVLELIEGEVNHEKDLFVNGQS